MSIKSRFYSLMEKFLSLFTDKIVCISEAERDSAIRENVAREDKLVLIPNGIDIKAVIDEKGFDRSEIGVPEDAFVVGMIGRLTSQKSPDIFIRAAKLIHEKISNSFFIIVGDGEMRNEVEEYAKDNGIPLLVTGWTETPYSYLKVFNIALLLSRWEGFGLAIVEYMAAGINVIATNVDAIPTLIEDKINGLLVEVDNPEDVCNKVLFLIENPDLAQIMKINAFEKVKKMYDIRRVADQHVKMFNDILK